MRKKNWKAMFLCGAIVCISVIMAEKPVSAKKVSSNYVIKANHAYADFLEKKEGKFKWFKILRIGVNKEPILLAAENVLSTSGAYGSQQPGYTIGGKLFYFTGSKVKAVKGGNISTNDTGLLLTEKKGGIFVANHWGLGTLVKVKKGKTVGKAILVNYENGKAKYYKASMKKGKYYNRRRTTKAVYNKYVKKWMPDSERDENGISTKTIYLKRNTAINRSTIN